MSSFTGKHDCSVPIPTKLQILEPKNTNHERLRRRRPSFDDMITFHRSPNKYGKHVYRQPTTSLRKSVTIRKEWNGMKNVYKFPGYEPRTYGRNNVKRIVVKFKKTIEKK